MRTALICHRDNPLNRGVLPGFLASFSDLVGIVEIDEGRTGVRPRLRREWRRSGWRILDVLAFRLYYRLRLAGRDRHWSRTLVEDLRRRYPEPAGVPVHRTADPNSESTRAFLQRVRPDAVYAACKRILGPEIFSVPRLGTFLVHPGICPEYRNAHGCFWALARRDLERVGATLLRVDEGVDTGPVFGYYRVDVDERRESHVVIQLRSVYENLPAIARDLKRIDRGELEPTDTSGRESAAWGQPRLTDYLRWKRAARSA